MVSNLFMTMMACAAATIILMSLVFLVARKLKRFDLVDAAWGWAFMTVALVSFALQSGDKWQLDIQLIVTALVLVWGSRLSWHIMRRIVSTDREDPRYVELRKKWRGNISVNIFLRIYVLQAVLAGIISLPVILINQSSDSGMSVLVVVGLLLWTVGFLFESLGDSQLRRFVSDPLNKGKIMMHGVWKYTRHPNYFGELLQWWAIGIMCLSVPYGWLGLAGPALLSYLIIFVSGIRLNEKRFEGRAGWHEYKSRTSVLLPLPPKN